MTLLNLPPEVLIEILSTLGSDDLRSLLCVLRVCKRLNTLIRFTKKLQRILFFLPTEDGQRPEVDLLESIKRLKLVMSIPDRKAMHDASRVGYNSWDELNPIVRENFGPLLSHTMSYSFSKAPPKHTPAQFHCSNYDEHRCNDASLAFSELPFFQTKTSRRKWLRSEASWRRMLVSKKPTKRLYIYKATLMNWGDSWKEVPEPYEAEIVGEPDRRDDDMSEELDTRPWMTLGQYYDFFLSPDFHRHFTFTGWRLLPGKRLTGCEDWIGPHGWTARVGGDFFNALPDDHSSCVLLMDPFSGNINQPFDCVFPETPILVPLGKPLQMVPLSGDKLQDTRDLWDKVKVVVGENNNLRLLD